MKNYKKTLLSFISNVILIVTRGRIQYPNYDYLLNKTQYFQEIKSLESLDNYDYNLDCNTPNDYIDYLDYSQNSEIEQETKLIYQKNAKTQQTPLLSFIVNGVRLITRPVYLAIAITLIGLFPAKKLKLTAHLEPSNIKHTHTACFVSTEEIIRRVRKLTNSPDSINWLDRSEYEDELTQIYDAEKIGEFTNQCVDYYDLSYEYEAEGRCSSEEIWLMLKDKYEQSCAEYDAQYEHRVKSLALELKTMSVYVLKLSYCSLYYWPYSCFSYDCQTNEFGMTDEQIEKAKLLARQRIIGQIN
jgi:hypothetical protein